MRIKKGVNLAGIRPEMVLAALICEQVMRTWHVEYDMTVTSVCDGKHGKGSLHYVGQAIDIRTNDIVANKLLIDAQLKEYLGEQFDVVWEDTHLHVEFQPK